MVGRVAERVFEGKEKMKNSLSTVRKIAHRVRRWAEKIAQKYPDYFGEEDLSCLCGVASGKLLWTLKQAGIKAQIAVSECHAFVLWNGYVVDITATQIPYGREKVEIFKESMIDEMNDHDLWWYDIKRKFNSITAFINFQREVDWSIEQRYSRYKNLFKNEL